MLINAYSVYDSKTEAFLPPFYCRTDGEAIRNFTAAALDETHTFSQYAADFTLMGIGYFDDSSGQLTAYTAHNNLGTALQHRSTTINQRASMHQRIEAQTETDDVQS